MPLSEPRYRTIVVDPPWPQQRAGSLRGREGWRDAGGASKPMPYRTMSLADITALPVAELADPVGSHLYMWTTNHFLPHAFSVMAAWGWTYSTALVWAKAPMGHGLGGRYGISTEFILFGARGQLLDEDGPRPKVPRTWFRWRRPYDPRGKPMHSAKPDGFHAECVEVVSPGPYLELFARRPPALGWDVWGDQAPNAVVLPPLDAAAQLCNGAQPQRRSRG